jgi:hypothetical protein
MSAISGASTVRESVVEVEGVYVLDAQKFEDLAVNFVDADVSRPTPPD